MDAAGSGDDDDESLGAFHRSYERLLARALRNPDPPRPPEPTAASGADAAASGVRGAAAQRLKLLLSLRYLRAYYQENRRLRALLSHVLVHRRYVAC